MEEDVTKNIGLKDLELLGSIQPGDTVCVHSLSIAKHNSWATSFWRMYNFENRLKTIAWVGNVVNFATIFVCENYESSNNSGNHICNKLWKMKMGIENLCVTYEGDQRCLNFLKNYLDAASLIIFDTNQVILKYTEAKSSKPISFSKMNQYEESSIPNKSFVMGPRSMPELSAPETKTRFLFPTFGTSVTHCNYF